MKKHFISFAFVLTVVAAFFACNKENKTPQTPAIEVRGVYVLPSTLTLKIGDSENLKTIISPKNATDQSIVWESSRPDVATVNANGNVTAVSGGEAIITATSVNGFQGKCVVTVETAVTEVQVLPSTLTLKIGDTKTLSTVILPENATDKSIVWESSRPDVATVDENGKVTAVSGGEATITATSVNGIQGKCDVTVETPVTEVQVQPSVLSLKVGDTKTLSTIILPENAKDKSIVWASSRPDVATVDENGKVTAVSSGETIITATSVNGIQGQCTVTVGTLSPNADTEPMQEIPIL